MAFYAIAKILEEQDRRREERRRRQKERERQLNEARNEGRMEGIDLVLNNPNLQQHPDLHEQILKDVKAAVEEGERE